MKKNVVKSKSYSFAIEVVSTYKYLVKEKKEYVLSKQLLRSGTAIGALIVEGEHAQSKPDFLHKMNIALKEANETRYWLDLLKDCGYIQVDFYKNLCKEAEELIKLLASIVRTTKQSLYKNVNPN